MQVEKPCDWISVSQVTVVCFLVLKETLNTTMSVYNIKHNLHFIMFYRHGLTIKADNGYDLEFEQNRTNNVEVSG
jgi:hypothetical protein